MCIGNAGVVVALPRDRCLGALSLSWGGIVAACAIRTKTDWDVISATVGVNFILTKLF